MSVKATGTASKRFHDCFMSMARSHHERSEHVRYDLVPPLSTWHSGRCSLIERRWEGLWLAGSESVKCYTFMHDFNPHMRGELFRGRLRVAEGNEIKIELVEGEGSSD